MDSPRAQSSPRTLPTNATTSHQEENLPTTVRAGMSSYVDASTQTDFGDHDSHGQRGATAASASAHMSRLSLKHGRDSTSATPPPKRRRTQVTNQSGQQEHVAEAEEDALSDSSETSSYNTDPDNPDPRGICDLIDHWNAMQRVFAWLNNPVGERPPIPPPPPPPPPANDQ